MKKFLSVFISFALSLSISLPVFAENTASMDNFENKNTYSGNFSDVASSNWAAQSVSACYELGIMYGNSETKFSPGDNLTVAEALVMASRVHSIYHTGDTVVFSDGDPWYKPYADYAIRSGIISADDFSDLNAKITRAFMAYLFYNALPENEFKTINTISSIPDVSAENKNRYEIMGLYAAGVLTGSDAQGSFHPDDPITRAEAAAIISRVAKPSLRKTFTLAGDTSGEALNAKQISQKCSAAVAFLEVYNDEGKAIASGSGFFTDPEGCFVTNFHVIDGAASAKVTTTDGKIYDVSGVYDVDASRDTALLKVNGGNFSFLEIDTASLQSGADIFVIGSPYGLSNTISNGIISNPSRELGGLNFIQFTASISSGSSGGALINEYGKVIGITTSTLPDTYTSVSQNLNFAVPASHINDLSTKNIYPFSNIDSLAIKNLSLSFQPKQLTLAQGDYKTVTVKYTPGTFDHIEIESFSHAPVVFGEHISGDSFTLIVLGAEECNQTSVYVNYKYGTHSKGESFEVKVAAPSALRPVNDKTYLNGAPSYQYVTDTSTFVTCFLADEKTASGYFDIGDAFVYRYYEESYTQYIKALEKNGWEFSYTRTVDSYIAGDIETTCYSKGDSGVLLAVIDAAKLFDDPTYGIKQFVYVIPFNVIWVD